MPSFDLRVNGSTQTVTVRDANEPEELRKGT
jgi:hypothetical protein